MNADEKVRRRIVILIAVLAALLVIDGCGLDFAPYGCATALTGKCSHQLMQDEASPSGAHAKVITQHCVYKRNHGESWTTQVFLDHVAGFEKNLELPDDGAIAGPSVFHAWRDPQIAPPPEVQVLWRSADELLVTYPAGVGHMCNQWKGIMVHCAERGLTPSR